MAERPNVEIINPPHRIRERVSGGGPISKAMLDRAEAAIESLENQFSQVAALEVQKLTTLHREASENRNLRDEKVQGIFVIAHDLRGQGSTFDYPLVTRIGSSLCTFTEQLDSSDDKALEVIGVHIGALHAVVSNAVRGDGGAVGKEIAMGLEMAVKKILSSSSNGA